MKQLKIYTYAKKDLEAPKEGVYQLSKGFGEISLLDGKSKGFKLTYKSLTYDFRIYEPSEVHVTLLCTPNEGVTLSAQTMVSLLKAEFLPAQSTPQETVSVDVLAENDQELATNFYVHSFGFTSKKEPIEKKDEKTVKANVLSCFLWKTIWGGYFQKVDGRKVCFPGGSVALRRDGT